ncbi:flagellar FliL protein [Blastomonas aquatica]|uniref:Flagellar protein FliL n=2 Tax=Blastomonas aquatica TaxID=1510276 RepID=A0ABQ1JSS7_9SPHN|nr:flagellar basal body-associated FliL family protein [Blastomonas aquatica]GGB74429.1 flagellar FliL protein [Blastomonas aquatica]
MATDTDDQALIEAEADGETKQPRFSKKKKVIAAAVAGVLVLAGTGSALMLSGGDDAADEANADDDADKGESGDGKTNFVEVAPMVINLRSSDGQARFLKLRFLLAASSPGDMAVIEAKLPQILDRYQPFLRELRPDDLAGSAAVYRLKEELLLRARDVLGAGVVSDVLIQDMIQQ